MYYLSTIILENWLQGMFELKAHLAMVFIHDIDPSYPAEQQQQLNELHSGIEPLASKPTFVVGGIDENGKIYRC